MMKSLDDLNLKPYAGMLVTVLPWAGEEAKPGEIVAMTGTGWAVWCDDGNGYVLGTHQIGPREAEHDPVDTNADGVPDNCDVCGDAVHTDAHTGRLVHGFDPALEGGL